MKLKFASRVHRRLDLRVWSTSRPMLTIDKRNTSGLLLKYLDLIQIWWVFGPFKLLLEIHS